MFQQYQIITPICSDYIKERNRELWQSALVQKEHSQVFILQNANSLLHAPLNLQPPLSSVPLDEPLPSRSCTPPLPDVSALRDLDFSWDKAVHDEDAWNIETGFDPAKNTKVGYNREDAHSRYQYTQKQRNYTHGAKEAHSVEELDILVCFSFYCSEHYLMYTLA